MKLKKIKQIAEYYKRRFEPYCKRVEIAGSIRRKKLNPKDIEIVAIPKKGFKNFKGVTFGFLRGKYIKDGDKYKQIELPEGVILDLFLCSPENWGNIFLIRTGNAGFSRWMMGFKIKEYGCVHSDGYLWKKKNGEFKPVKCFEEQDIFNLCNMKFIEPEKRHIKMR